MMRKLLRLVMLLGAVALASCAAPFGPPRNPTAVDSINLGDQFDPTAEIDGASGRNIDAYGSFRWFIASFIDKKNFSVLYEFYITTDHSGGAFGLTSATDETATELPIKNFGTNTYCLHHHHRDCSSDEDAAIVTTEAWLRSHLTTGYAIKVRSSYGVAYILQFTPAMIRLQLDAVAQTLATLGAPPSTAASMPNSEIAGAKDLHTLGIQVDPLSPNNPAVKQDPSLKGVHVVFVAKGSPADQAGIRTGDIITEADNKPVTSVDDLRAAFKARVPGQSFAIRVVDQSGGRTIHQVMLPTAPPPAIAQLCEPLGVRVVPLAADDPLRTIISSSHGVRVTAVDAASPAARMGIVPGDTISQFNAEAVDSCDDVQFATWAMPARGANVLARGYNVAGAIWSRTTTAEELTLAATIGTEPGSVSLADYEGLGIETFAMLPNEPAPTGIYVTKVAPGSPAAHAIIRPGDRIVTLDGKPITSIRALLDAVDASGGRRVQATIWSSTLFPARTVSIDLTAYKP